MVPEYRCRWMPKRESNGHGTRPGGWSSRGSPAGSTPPRRWGISSSSRSSWWCVRPARVLASADRPPPAPVRYVRGLASESAPLRLGIVGTGFIAAVHAACAARSSRVELIAVSGIRGRARPDSIPGLDPAVRLATSGELLAMDDVEAVLVCSRTVDHVEHATAVLGAGKHLLLEKPGAIGTGGQTRIREAAAAQPGVVARVAYHRRHDARFRELARLIAEGAIGRPFAIQMESRENFPPGPDDLAAGG